MAKARKGPDPEQEDPNKLTKEQARRKAMLVNDLMTSPGYKWLVGELKTARKAWRRELVAKKPVGEGAADIARAQGALIVLQSMLDFPKNTLQACNDIVSGVAEPAGIPKDRLNPEDEDEEDDE